MNDVVTPKISKKEAVKKLHDLIDIRNKLTIKAKQLQQQYLDETRPHVQDSIASLWNELILTIKKTNRRIVLLNKAIAEDEICDILFDDTKEV
jgi:hypothetical protein